VITHNDQITVFILVTELNLYAKGIRLLFKKSTFLSPRLPFQNNFWTRLIITLSGLPVLILEMLLYYLTKIRALRRHI